ncbi:MAG: 50S ribosomal protein L23 [Bacteroidota bacterium]|nr:50S ribosomal protein L23 [Bacteroidota bacterium]
MNNILIKPLITEKMNNITAATEAGEVKYGFIVNVDSNKIDIAKAIEKRFNVKVASVNTVRHPGKVKTQFRKGGRFTGRTSQFKKAIVTLKKGDKIDLFEQV